MPHFGSSNLRRRKHAVHVENVHGNSTDCVELIQPLRLGETDRRRKVHRRQLVEIRPGLLGSRSIWCLELNQTGGTTFDGGALSALPRSCSSVRLLCWKARGTLCGVPKQRHGLIHSFCRAALLFITATTLSSRDALRSFGRLKRTLTAGRHQ